jgi:ankyrin repeat protein
MAREKCSHDLKLEPEVKEISKSDQGAQKAWERFIHILRNFACQRNDSEYQLLNALLEQHPELIELVDEQRRNLLSLAILYGRPNVVALLLFLGSPFEIQDANGNTPLLLAIWKELTDAVVLLLAYGADPSVRNGDGFNAYQLACTNNNPNIIAIMLEKFPMHHELRPKYLTEKNKINIVRKE